MPEKRLLAMGDIADEQLETRDRRYIGRVADLEAEWRDDGSLVLTGLVVGPQALVGRVASRLVPLARFILRDRFDHCIPMSEIEEMGTTIRLRGTAEEYPIARSERWIARHILRFIPGSGR